MNGSRRSAEARDQQRLLRRQYLRMPSAPWRTPSPEALPAAHRQLEREVVDQRVVDAHDAGLDPPGDRARRARVSRVHTDAASP